ncbi:MAG: hypothetical protein DI569_12860 [Sphingopyxis macrogoltabida]|uniref:DUF2116 family Zn-ribbon domain-containing protein n=1 Tax=Sphingopyxis macrogoltabida TaxID=33050 RepID=A0A2W5N4W2_SPHMC|nr:MAG: hypothetical protein DI569_12860 [Sphingopyxis macrogoltabida]
MADIIDRAAELEEMNRADALARRKPDGPPATGHCLNCGEPMPEGRRWCDADCRDDWQAERARK